MGSPNLLTGGVGRNRDSEPMFGFITCCQCCDQLDVVNSEPPDRGKLRHLSLVVRGGLCWWRETTTKCLLQQLSPNVTPKTTEQHLIVHSDKCVAYVTNSKRLCSTFCTVEANHWQTRSTERPLCDNLLLFILLF